MSIFYFLISIITSIFFIRKKYNTDNTHVFKYLSSYLVIIIVYFILLILNYYFYNLDSKIVSYKDLHDKITITHVTTSSIQILLGLIFNMILNISFYYITKKIYIKLFNNKFKYIILFIFIILLYSGMMFGYLSFYGFVTKFYIKNIILNILRYVSTFLPIIIFPLDIFIIDKLKKQD